jgi:hypothetical protein
MSYQENLKKHLVEYKRQYLRIGDSGMFSSAKGPVPHEHILPLTDSSRNLFEEAERLERALPADRRPKRHQLFHHLNSSQAFAFNLFFPYFSGTPDAASGLLRALGCEGILADWAPEKVPEADEATNIDVYWRTTEGTSTFCEVKLSEAEFGKAADDDKHREKFEKTYSQALTPHFETGMLERLAFFDGYQFYRNVWHMVREERSRLIFLMPRANTGLWKKSKDLILGVLPPTRARISVVAMEDVINALCSDEGCSGEMRKYAGKLKQKYVI